MAEQRKSSDLKPYGQCGPLTASICSDGCKWLHVLKTADPLDVRDWAQRSHQCLTSS
jgi:hypothetical protein